VPLHRMLLADTYYCCHCHCLPPPARCVAEDPTYKDSGRSISECTGPCNSCADATKSCPADDSLPGACTSYSGDPAVRKCIGARRLA
jgi:hypothetical protein